jgi:hypothetical protein
MQRSVWQHPGAGDQRGTILVVTVVAMLILGILAISFAALGNLEVRIGLNDVWDKQAAFVAEGGIAAVRNQIENPPNYTAFLGHVYSCTTSSCTCTGTGCGTTGLATVSTGEFSVRVDNDPDELAGPSPAVDANQRVVLTALGITRGPGGRVMGRTRIRAWLTNDDPWDHVCASGEPNPLCTEPPNNPNADINPPDTDDPNGPRAYPQIPVPNQIRCTAVAGGDPAAFVAPGDDRYPVPNPPLNHAPAPAPAPRGPCVMYPYYLTALTTPCNDCNPPTSAYHPAACNTGDLCLGMVRFDADLDIRSGTSNSGRLGVSGNTLHGTLYVTGRVRMQSQVGTVLGTIVVHGDAIGATGDLDLAGPHTITTQGPACPSCAYPLAILAYNPNEPSPPGQTVFLNISNNNIVITGVVYTGGRVDFGPNTVNGSVLGYQVNANNAATEFHYVAYDPLPPPGFSTPALNLPSVIARGTWLQCRTADNLTDLCD